MNKICIVLLLLLYILFSPSASSALAAEELPQLNTEFPQHLSEAMPHDIPFDPPLTLKQEQQLEQDNLPALKRIFDIFSWQSFLAVSWPVNQQGEPLVNLTDSGFPRWQTWQESLQIFRPDGKKPIASTPRSCPQNQGQNGSRELYTTSSFFSNKKDQDIADEVVQAFTQPLYDQNGQEVRYEIFINEAGYNYIIDNKLYNYDGQIEFSQAHNLVQFPAGKYGGEEVGTIELKLAWKELGANDIPSRFYTETLLLPELDAQGEPVLDRNGNFRKCQEKTMGLVGMHIAHKTQSSPQWIWSTFEHIDNLQVNELETFNGKKLYPLFHDNSINGQILPVNVPPIKRDPKTGKPDLIKGIKRTQVMRVIPISKETKALNDRVQALLAQQGSVLQYYQLIGTQWPTNPSLPSVPGSPNPDALPEAITHKSSGAPTPVYLTNSIMETYLQAGNQKARFQENSFPPVSTLVFGTKSCMGCHFSAGIAADYIMIPKNPLKPDGEKIKKPIFSVEAATADFSWLLQQKAHFLSNE